MGFHARNAAICRLQKPNAPEKFRNYAHNEGSLMADTKSANTYFGIYFIYIY